MASRFSSLSKTKTAELHKEIKAEYKGYSSSQIDEEYATLKHRYEDLKIYTEMSRDSADEYKQLRYKAQSAKYEANRAKSNALNSMGTIKAIGTIFSSKPYYSQEHQVATSKQHQYGAELLSFKHDLYSDEVSERKLIYHKLKVLSEIRKKHKEARTRSLANAKLNKVRSTSSSLKKRALDNHHSDVECPYCTKLFSKDKMVLDHIYPIAEGGLDTERNTVLVCFKCNSNKSDLTLIFFSRKFKLNYDAICNRLDKLKKIF
jgi:5-methylcytosine-specific restriction endonuclease McrA